MTDTDPKKDSQLSRADQWLTEAIDPSKEEQPPVQEEPKDEEEAKNDDRN